MRQKLVDVNKIKNKCNDNWPSDIVEGFQMAIDVIEDAPIIEVVPVRYGRWVEVDVGDCCYRCSECGFIRDAYLLDIGNYCPQCGAKMDEVENEDR